MAQPLYCSMIKSICLVRLSALGDVLMMVPLVRTLQAAFPQAQLTWIISRPAYDLVEGMSGVEFIVINKPNNLKDYWQFHRTIRHRHFDVLLAPQASLRANLLYPLIRATRKIGYDPARAKDAHGWFIKETIQPGQEHTLRGFLKFAEVLGVDDLKIEWNMPIFEAEKRFAKANIPQGTGPLILLNPAASKPERSWMVERYIHVITHAQVRWNARIMLIGGPGPYDKALADEIQAAVNVPSMVGKTKPKQLLALIQSADLVICPDTGPAHMATAVGTRVIALHAVTNPDVSGPYTFLDLAINYYPNAVEHCLQQPLKMLRWGTQVHGDKAMALIPVDAVIQRMDEVLA